MKKVMENSIRLVDLAPLINRESENLNEGTAQLEREVVGISREMSILNKKVLKEIEQAGYHYIVIEKIKVKVRINPFLKEIYIFRRVQKTEYQNAQWKI